MNPDGLNNLFANNVGPDEVQVFDGAVTLSSANTGSGPRDFDIVLPFATPFFYDPANGNLLWEVRRRSATTSLHYLDAEDTLGDSVSVLYNEPNFGAETGVPFTIGVVTRFDYTPVPEPVTLAIFASGTLALLGRRRRR